MTTQRLRMELSYDGSAFHGWARQPGLRTVEGDLGEALATIFRRPVPLTVAGRTDAGVHARRQVAHFDLDRAEWNTTDGARLRGRIQSLLRGSFSAVSAQESRQGGADLLVRELTPVDSAFDARFSAIERRYCYRLVDRQGFCDPLNRTNFWWQPRLNLDVPRMQVAAASLLGQRSFLSFCRPRDGATTIRTLRAFEVERRLDGHIEFKPEADAFCHSMVRSLVGALIEVGQGRRNLSWLEELVSRPSRSHGTPVAPARGLTLEEVVYPPQSDWAQRARQARNRRSDKNLDGKSTEDCAES